MAYWAAFSAGGPPPMTTTSQMSVASDALVELMGLLGS
jgi:hypothetical protein